MQTIFLKLGGSLITDKSKPSTPNIPLLKELAQAITRSYQNNTYRLVLGHGSGSFGHQPAKKYGTRQGVQTQQDWFGFLEVWKQARALNQIVIDLFTEAGLAVLSFPPVSAVIAESGRVLSWDTQPIRSALQNRLVPVIYGDVIFDRQLNGTILSTEELFIGLADQILPYRVLIAGIEPGVWKDYPKCTAIHNAINSSAMQDAAIQGSASVDVTGGMAEKVKQMLNLVQYHSGVEVQIFSGTDPQEVAQVLEGKQSGTLIYA